MVMDEMKHCQSCNFPSCLKFVPFLQTCQRLSNTACAVELVYVVIIQDNKSHRNRLGNEDVTTRGIFLQFCAQFCVRTRGIMLLSRGKFAPGSCLFPSLHRKQEILKQSCRDLYNFVELVNILSLYKFSDIYNNFFVNFRIFFILVTVGASYSGIPK